MLPGPDSPGPSGASSRSLAGELLFLVLLVGLVTWANLTWAALDQAPPPSDASAHSYHSLVFVKGLEAAPGPGPALSRFLLFRLHYPPLVYETTALAYQVLGTGTPVALLSLAPFLLLLTVGAWATGRKLGGRAVGLACGVVACTAPPVLELSRHYFLDLPLAGMVAVTLACLVHSESFRHRGWSLGFGACLGLGMLTKWTLPLYLQVSLLASIGYLVVRSSPAERRALLPVAGLLVGAALGGWLLLGNRGPALQDSPAPLAGWLGLVLLAAWLLRALLRWTGTDARTPLANAAGAALLCLGLAAPWYFANLDFVLDRARYQTGLSVPHAEVLAGNLHDLSTWLSLGPVLLGAGLATGLARRETRRTTLQLAGDFGAALGVLSFLPRDMRYLLPAAVPLLPLCFLWLRALGRAAAVPLVLLAGLGLYQASWHLGPPLGLPVRQVGVTAPGWLHPLPVLPAAPDRGSYPYPDLMAAMTWAPAPGPTAVDVLVLPEHAAILQPRTLFYYAALEGRDLRVFENFGRPSRSPDPGPPSGILLFYPDASAREELVRDLDRRPIEGLRVETNGPTFRFGSRITVEVLKVRPADGKSPGAR